MSLVGTRPPTVDEWEQYELHHRSRMSTKPGITGMWQVSGRSDITDFEEVVRLDTEYIQYAICLPLLLLIQQKKINSDKLFESVIITIRIAVTLYVLHYLLYPHENCTAAMREFGTINSYMVNGTEQNIFIGDNGFFDFLYIFGLSGIVWLISFFGSYLKKSIQMMRKLFH